MNSEASLRRLLLSTAAGLTVLLAPFVPSTACAGSGLPAGGQYVAGKGAIGGNAGSLVVRQSSTTGIIDWNSFSIGKGSSVTFNNGSGATLNEVTGGVLSTIAGALHASGSLYLINQDGIIVSGSGRIVTGGSFVASTGDGTQHGAIVDAGTIRSAHGSIHLSAANVSVPGSIVVERGGHLWLTSSGTASVSGMLDAVDARGAGGTIVVAGKTVDVAGTADISASGKTRGGTILIGGDVHGGAIAADNFVSAPVATAQTTSVAKGATIFADASQGAGGDIVIWSDGHTSFAGAIRATGKRAGGFAEVSSHDLLGFRGTADLTAQSGATGTLLLDPENVTIESSTTANGSFGGGSPDTFTPTGDNSILNVTDLEAALAGANVLVTTGTTGAQAGTITVASPFAWTSDHTLTLNAAGAITVDAAINGSGAAVNLISGSTITSNSSGIITANELLGSSSGAVTLNAANAIGVLGAFSTGNGNFSLTNSQTLLVNGTLNAGTGTLTLTLTATGGVLGIQNALTGGTVDLVSSGTIVSGSAGVITAGMLTGSSAGRARLISANEVGDLGAFNSGNGEFAFASAGPLTVMGAVDAGTSSIKLTTTSDDLIVDAALTGSAVDLISAGTITSDSAGIITATKLLGSSQGGTTLNADNAIAYLETFTTNDNDFSLTDTRSIETADALDVGTADATLVTTGSNSTLEIARALTAGTATLQAGGTLEINAAVTGTTLDTISGGNINEGRLGAISATTLAGSSGGYTDLAGPNAFTNLGSFSTGSAFFILNDAASLTVTGAFNASTTNSQIETTGTGHNIAIDAPVTATGYMGLESAGTLNLDAPVTGTSYLTLVAAGTIRQNSAGTITTSSLSGSSVGNTMLTSAPNAIGQIASFTTDSGNFSLTNTTSLSLDNLDAGAGNLTLTTVGANSNLAIEPTSFEASVAGNIVDLVSAGTITGGYLLIAQTLTGSSVGETQLSQSEVANLGTFTAVNGGFSLNDFDKPLVVTGNVTAGDNGVLQLFDALGVTINAPVNGGTVELYSASSINQSSAGIITASQLNVTTNSQAPATLTANNKVGTASFGTIDGQPGSTFDFTDATSLTVGEINLPGGTVTLQTVGASSNLAIQSTVTAATVDLTSAGAITEGSTASDDAGSVIANLLNVTANTGITLNSTTNNITTIGTDTTNSGPNIIVQN